MKRITAALLFLLTIPGLAGAQTRISRDSYWTGHLEMCEDGLGGRPFPEALALIGTSKYSFKTSENGGFRTVEMSQAEVKGKAIGLVTGNEYTFHTQSKSRTTFSQDMENEVEIIIHDTFTIPDIGYKVRYNADITFGIDGQMNIDIRNIRLQCP